MKPGVPMAARYRQTHWVGSWRAPLTGALAIFDVNAVNSGGWCNLEPWERILVPHLTGHIAGADGTWSMTHAVELETNGR